MKVVLQLLFLAFYAASSYAVGQERTDFVAERLERRVSQGNEERLEEIPGSIVGFPRYREAKPKPFSGLFFQRLEAVRFAPSFSFRAFAPQMLSFKSIFSTETIQFRAPPVGLAVDRSSNS